MNRTKTYRFDLLAVGQSIRIPLGWDMQHARVAASEHGRRHNKVFTCRKQEDGSMLIYRVELTQRDIDTRGRNSHRAIPSTEILTLASADQPTQAQFTQWLTSFTVGQRYTLPLHYSTQYRTWVGWTIDHSLHSHQGFTTTVDSDGSLIIVRYN